MPSERHAELAHVSGTGHALVRNLAILHKPDEECRAFVEFSELLSLRYRRSPRTRCEPLIGIWVDPDLEPGQIAQSYGQAPAVSGALGQISETITMGEVWTLFFFDGGAAARLPVVDALRRASKAAAPDAPSFIPVFRTDLARSEIEAELLHLGRSPTRVARPVLQDAETGRLVLPDDYAA